MGRREGRFPGAPGGSRREGRERVSTSSSLSSSPTPGLEAARGVERGLRAFRSIAGEAGTEKDESEFHGFSEDEISVASSRAESLRKEGDTIKHTLAQARGEAIHDEAAGLAPAPLPEGLSSEEPESFKKDQKRQQEVKKGAKRAPRIVQSKLPNSESSSESGKTVVKTALKSSIDKSLVPKLNSFKNFLHSKLKKKNGIKLNNAEDEDGTKAIFHGFSDDEIRSASLNDSSSERSSIISSLSRDEKKKKKRKSEGKTVVVSEGGEPSLPLLHQNLIVEGKRQKKPSFKLKDKAETPKVRQARTSSVESEASQIQAAPEGLAKTVQLYANAITEGGQGEKGKELKQIEAILQSGWKKEKKTKPVPAPVQAPEEPKKKPVLKESILEVDTPAELPILHELQDSAVKLLRKTGGCEKLQCQVQNCLRGTSTKPPQLLKSQDNQWVNPTGAALTLPGQLGGNIVCGICGFIVYSEDVSKQLKFGAYSCSLCITFLTPLVFRKAGTKALAEVLKCNGKGECTIQFEEKTKCQACWLLLCLLGCHFPPKTFTKLEALLPKELKKHPDSSSGSVKNAGKVLLCSQKYPLDRPLQEKGTESVSSSSATSEEILGHLSRGDARRSVVTETLANNWTKKAVRRIKGSHTGKWDVYLVTPDSQVLRSPQQLKLFTAKTGAIIDTNIVNFNLPQRTFLMESQLQILNAKKDEEKSNTLIQSSKENREKTELKDNEAEGSTSTTSSKRVSKTPKKFHDFEAQTATPREPHPNEIEKEEPKTSPGKYQCDECERNFKKKSHLDEHILIHAGEKPHKCEKCGWSFRRADKMRKHMETCNYVNRETEYAAFLKPDKRKSSEGLKAVLTANTNSARWTSGIYVCDVCEKDCGYRQNLYIHMKRHEKNGEWTRPATGPMFPKINPPREDTLSGPQAVKKGRGRPKRGEDEEMVDGDDLASKKEPEDQQKDTQQKIRRVGTIIAAKSSRTFRTPAPVEQDEDSKDTSDVNEGVEKADDETSKSQRTKWRGGAPPSYWVWGRYICEVCKKDCGYANNLGLHRKRSHGLTYRQERLGYDGEIERGSKLKQNPNEPGYGMSRKKRKRDHDEETEQPKGGQRFISKAMPCFECDACKADDCLQCKWCHDKKKHGGPGRLNKRCIQRRCTKPKIVEMMDHMTSKPMKMIRLEGGDSAITYSTTPVRTTYLQAGGLVKAMPCRVCSACTMEDCGACRFCLDKRKFGGPGKMNKRCREKKCLTPKDLGAPSTVPTTYVRKMPEFVSSKFLNEGDKPRQARDPKETIISYDDEDEDNYEQDDEVPVPLRPDHQVSLENFVSMGLESGARTPNYLGNIEMEEFNKERGKQGEQPRKALKTIPVCVDKLSPSKCNVAVEFFEAFDEDSLLYNGTGVISNEKGTNDDLCFTCGASGGGKMIYCIACCEPHHPFCLPQEDMPGSDLAEETWVCNRCSVCKVCGDGAQGEEGERSCDVCRHLFHAGCLPADQKEMKGDAWTCGSCVSCAGCGSGTVSHQTSEEALCGKCCRARMKGSYCPVCKGCYEEDDYEQAMIECGQCGGWIHAKCEGLDGEQYQTLSLLPDSVEYVCKCPSPPSSSPSPITARRSSANPNSPAPPAPPPLPLPVLLPTPGSPLHRAHTPVLQSLNEAQPGPSSVNDLAFARTFPNLSGPVSVAIPTAKLFSEPQSYEYLEPDVQYHQEISPKPSEAIDDECDFVTLDSSVFALPTAIETAEPNSAKIEETISAEG